MEQKVTMEDICQYLDGADVDMRIKSPKGGWASKNLHAVQKYVTENGARTEFMGNGYDALGNAWVPDEKTKAISMNDPVYFGTYSIWYPHPLDPARWIRYELSIFNTSTSGFYKDFTVNQLTQNSICAIKDPKYPEYYKDGYRKELWFIINHITTKNLSIYTQTCGFSTLLKRAYRMRKMWHKGYRPLTYEEREDINEVIKKLTPEHAARWSETWDAHILEDEYCMTKPSVLDGEPTTIYPMKYKYKKLSIDDVVNDPVIKEIISYCRVEVLHKFSNRLMVLKEVKYLGLPESTPKSEIYVWSCYLRGQRKKLEFKSMTDNSREFQDGSTVTFDDTSCVFTVKASDGFDLDWPRLLQSEKFTLKRDV
jgi:hypothetical protein